MSDQKLPPRWTDAKLGDLGKWTSGGTPPSKVPEYYNGDIPWVVTGDLADAPLRKITNKITSDGLKNSSAKVFPEGTLLVAMYGATIGKLGILIEPAATNQACAALIPAPDSSEIIPYVFYFLLSQRENLKKLGQGGAQPNISQTLLKEVAIPVAPLNEQKRIVDKIEQLFSDLNKGIALLSTVQKQLATYRQSVLKAAVTGELTREWRKKNKRHAESGALSLQRILKSRRENWKGRGKYQEPETPRNPIFSDIPDSWTIATIDQISSIVDYGTSAKCTTDDIGVAVLRMGNIQDGALDLENLKYLPKKHEEFPRLLLSDGDLLFNRTNSAELVGKTAVYRGKPQSCSFASYLIRVKLIESEPEYISAFINSAYGKAWIKAVVSQQVGQANVNGTKLKALAIPLPPKEEQEEIVQLMADIFSKVSTLENWCAAELQRSNTLRQSILKSAFSGKLVLQDSADEPASVLLARIQSMHAQPAGASSARRSRKSKASEAA